MGLSSFPFCSFLLLLLSLVGSLVFGLVFVFLFFLTFSLLVWFLCIYLFLCCLFSFLFSFLFICLFGFLLIFLLLICLLCRFGRFPRLRRFLSFSALSNGVLSHLFSFHFVHVFLYRFICLSLMIPGAAFVSCEDLKPPKKILFTKFTSSRYFLGLSLTVFLSFIGS